MEITILNMVMLNLSLNNSILKFALSAELCFQIYCIRFLHILFASIITIYKRMDQPMGLTITTMDSKNILLKEKGDDVDAECVVNVQTPQASLFIFGTPPALPCKKCTKVFSYLLSCQKHQHNHTGKNWPYL